MSTENSAAKTQRQGDVTPPTGEAPPTGEQRHRERIAPFIVEVADKKNSGALVFAPLRMMLRSRWDNGNYHGGKYFPELGPMSRLPVIPGMRLAINVRDKQIRVYDPLSENKELLDSLNELLSSPEMTPAVDLNASKRQPVPESIIDCKEDDDLLVTVMLEVSRLCYLPEQVRMMIPVNGSTVPTVQEIKRLMPGRELYDMMSNSSTKPKYVDEVAAWETVIRRMIDQEMGLRRETPV